MSDHASDEKPGVFKLPEIPAALLRGPIRTIDTHPLSGINKSVAVWITNKVGTMWSAYLFALISLVALPAAIRSGDPIIIVAWISQAFLQLVLLPVIIVGQNVQAAHADARSEADHELAKTSHEILTVLNQINQRQLTILNELDAKSKSAS